MVVLRGVGLSGCPDHPPPQRPHLSPEPAQLSAGGPRREATQCSCHSHHQLPSSKVSFPPAHWGTELSHGFSPVHLSLKQALTSSLLLPKETDGVAIKLIELKMIQNPSEQPRICWGINGTDFLCHCHLSEGCASASKKPSEPSSSRILWGLPTPSGECCSYDGRPHLFSISRTLWEKIKATQ